MHFLEIVFKRNINSQPEVIEEYRYKYKVFRWFKRVMTVGYNITDVKNNVIEKYSIYPYFKEWQENSTL